MTDRTTDSAVANSSTIMGLFAKSWDPGTVKTRLAKTLGNDRAAEIFLELLTLNLGRFAQSADRRVIGYSPPGEATLKRFESLVGDIKPRPAWNFAPQSDGDLGTRMSTFFRQQFEIHGAGSRVVLIGSDALQLMPRHIDQAFELLNDHDVVFGPSTDGGYYLVGMSVMNDRIFQDVAWSMETVLEQSLERCESSGSSVAQLEPLTDIDNETDLLQEMKPLKNAADEDEIWRQRFLENVNRILERPAS